MSPPSRAGPAIEARGLAKAFGRVPVLRGLDLDVQWGEVVAVLGPNGSGKSTLIRALAGLTKLDAGVLRIAGADVSRAGASVRRVLGVVTHDTVLYDDLTAHENLRFHARMFSLDRIDERIAAMAERMGATAYLHRRVSTLSHGMKKRFTIARALMHGPSILLLDEPESGLDQEAIALFEAAVVDPAFPNRAVLMTTHALERAAALGNRLAILARGRFAFQCPLESASVDELRSIYARHAGAAP